MKQLYTDQLDVLRGVQKAIRGGARSPLLQLATGGGKTVIGCHLIHAWYMAGGTAWVLVHRQELERQWLAELEDVGITAGVIRGQAAPLRSTVQVCSVPTLAKRIKKGLIPAHLPHMHAIITDEAHHAPAASYQAIYAAAEHTGLGLTATPARLDGKPLGEHFDALVEGLTPAKLIELGRLSDYEIRTLPVIEREGLKRRSGDFARGEASERVRAKVADIGQVWKEHASDRHTLVFATSVADGRAIHDRLREVGADARYCDGKTPPARRTALMQEFHAKSYNVLVTVDLIGEGFDVPGADCTILARPTESQTIHLQQIGRVLRRQEGKDKALILDCVGNVRHLGGPRTPRRWSLTEQVETDLSVPENGQKIAGEGRKCAKCGTISPPGSVVCVGCTRKLSAQPAILADRLVTIDDSTLKISESKPGVWARRDVHRALARCHGPKAIFALAQQLGYSRQWAERRIRMRNWHPTAVALPPHQ